MSRGVSFRFKLYIAGDAPNSTMAVANLRAFCRANLPDRFEIEVVDVFREPKQALLEGIFMTPTLVVLAPLPLRRIIGTLSETEVLRLTLGIAPLAA